MSINLNRTLLYVFITLSVIFTLTVGYLHFDFNAVTDSMTWIVIYTLCFCVVLLFLMALIYFYKIEKINKQNTVQYCNGLLARINSIITHSGDAIFSCDLNGRITSWSHSATVMYGWKKDEILGNTVSKLYNKFPSKEFLELAKNLQKGEKLGHLEAEYLRKDGQSIWVNVSYSPKVDKLGKVAGISVITQDVTENKQKHLILESELRKFRIYVETTFEWIWEIDTRYFFIYSNNSIERILGFPNKNIQGISILELMTPECRDRFMQYLKEIFDKKRKRINDVFTFHHQDGSIRHIEIHANAIYENELEMNVVGILGNGLDVTKAKDLERLKSELIAIVSHELRTPLTSIHAAFGLLKSDKSFTGKSKELIEVAYRNTMHLNAIINDILDLDNIEFEKFKINNESIILEHVIRESIRLSQPLEDEYKIEFVAKNMLPEVKVYADPQRLHQVIANLLSNAAKFSFPNGKVYISMQDLGDRVLISIRDEGEGIPEAYHNKIFARFSRIDVSDARRTKGSGLGLIICKKIIEQLGGEIGFSSKLKEGSTFYFDLPKI